MADSGPGGPPHTELGERYAYQPRPPHSLGWWSEPDGTDPPAAAQRPVDSGAPAERALRLPLVPSSERMRVALPPATVWPIDGAPFEHVRWEETLGKHVAPYMAPYLQPYDLVVDQSSLHAVGPLGPGYDDLAVGAAVQWLAAWHGLYLSPEHVVRPTLAWIARVLSVVAWAMQPRLDLHRAMYQVVDGVPPADEHLLRLCRVGAIVGGGNLHAMVCLSWAAVVHSSRRLAAALRACPERMAADEVGLGIDQPLRDALAGLGAIPGHPLARWSSRREALSSPYVHFVWGRRRPAQIADACLATLRSLAALGAGQSRDRSRLPSKFTGPVRESQWDDLLRRNMHVYSDFSRRALGSVVTALRLLLHVTYRTLVYYTHSGAWDPRDPPHAYVPALERLQVAPVHALHVVFDQFAEQCALPRPVLWTLEAELYRTVAHLAPSAIGTWWAVPSDRPDSFDRAGAFCPAGAYYIRIPIVPPSALPSAAPSS